MSSHWEWAARKVAEHDAEKPFAPENGQPLAFKPGDRVIFTNDAGIEFEQTITGYYSPEGTDALYANGARYLVDSTSPWFPVKEAALRLAAPGSPGWGEW